MIGTLAPQHIPLALIPARPAVARTYVIACCGQCGNATGSMNARVCVRTDCGLTDRHHNRSDAA